MIRRSLHRGHAPQRILATLRLGIPLTTAQLQRGLFLNSSTAQDAIRRLHARGLVRPVGFEERAPCSRRRAGAIRWSLSGMGGVEPAIATDTAAAYLQQCGPEFFAVASTRRTN